MKTVTPKTNIQQIAPMYGEMSGVAVELHLERRQKWTATKSAGYWWLRRKGSPIRIRLTDRMMNILFEEVEDNV